MKPSNSRYRCMLTISQESLMIHRRLQNRWSCTEEFRQMFSKKVQFSNQINSHQLRIILSRP
ncbi:hypothetical protein PBCV1_a092/093aL [Paramecium bursaria Chlorella virus 1]|uniref:Uncharacterized protein n=1 Tax=Paramecium bursaria Chlorella virus 1 TaxID=10506 RepID=F8TTX7_PBCV1|nr:hypothetical protein PBCV1_a092/093aL [Paramecium bursaria Chlorella virus 1]AEI70038.1 hypothetical protein [Paramecium bursaria Chlorella virus 1]